VSDGSAHGLFELAVVDPDPELADWLAREVGEAGRVAIYPGVSALGEHQPVGRPVVAVFGPGLANGQGLAEIERLTGSRPEIGAILVASELSTGLLQQALRSGVRDVLGAPIESPSFQESIDRVGRSLAVPTVPPVVEERAERGKVITVSSMKGGSGKTVVATNLAVTLAQRSPGPVVLVDADLQFGDVSVMLRLGTPHTIVDAVTAAGQLDADFLRSLLVRHDRSGLLVLPAPLEPSFAERVAGADMLRIIEVLQSFCSYVVVDTAAQLNDVVLAVLEASDDIVVVAGMEIPNIKNTKLGVQTLRMLGMPESKLRLLVNRANSKVDLNVGEVERTVGLKAEAHIPSDIAVPQAINRGVPVVLDAPRSDVTRAFEQLANLFLRTAPDVPMKKARGRFGRS
jgi:pilus assembly protein CpaE